MKVKCIVCGADIEQNTSTAKLYCSDHCCYTQLKEKRFSKEWLEAEKIRRRQTYIANLTEEEQNRIKNHAKKDQYYHYMSKPGELKQRVCTTCGKPCTNYRCAECWKTKRRGWGLVETVIPSESIWDDF